MENNKTKKKNSPTESHLPGGSATFVKKGEESSSRAGEGAVAD
jgi:hypothetical protein